MCMPSERTYCWRFKMKNSFASERAPKHISANMSEAGWSEKRKQEVQPKKLESVGISSTLDTMDTVLEWERSILLRHWRANPRANICAGAEGWIPSGWAASAKAGSVFSGGIQPLGQTQSFFLAAKARNTHNTTRAGSRCKGHFESWESKTQDFFHTISFLCQEPCCFQLCSVRCVV